MNKKPFNKTNVFMSMGAVFLVCLIWWGYLFFSAEMQIAADAIGYEQLGRVVKDQGWEAYFRRGPTREPFYPFLISMSMRLGDLWHCSYQPIQKIFQLIILFFTQILMMGVLRRLNVRDGIIALAVLYFGLSPAMTNSALSLYSEILVYPWVLLIVLGCSSIADGFPNKSWKTVVLSAAMLASLFLTVTLIKGIFEYVTLATVGVLLLIALGSLCQRKMLVCFKMVAFVCIFCLVYAIPLHAYKMQNKKYNNTYTLTDRGNWILYASVTRRLEPLSTQRLLTALAFTPGEGVCDRLFGKEACLFWTYKTVDLIGLKKWDEFNALGLSNDEMNRRFLQDTRDNIRKNPVQVILLTMLEGFKMFFWESTKIGYVQYSPWLASLYETPLLKDPLRGLMAFVTIAAFFYGFSFVWRQKKEIGSFRNKEALTILCVLCIACAFIGLYSLFFIATRYAFPIVSLYLILIAFMTDRLIHK